MRCAPLIGSLGMQFGCSLHYGIIIRLFGFFVVCGRFSLFVLPHLFWSLSVIFFYYLGKLWMQREGHRQ